LTEGAAELEAAAGLAEAAAGGEGLGETAALPPQPPRNRAKAKNIAGVRLVVIMSASLFS
jgi:hypothetical protein